MSKIKPVLTDWVTGNGVALFVLLFLPHFVDLPGPLASNPPGQPTGTRVAVAAAIGALSATFNLRTPKSRRVLAEMAAELTGNKAGVAASTVGGVGRQVAPPER
jgi:hypothetical protein